MREVFARPGDNLQRLFDSAPEGALVHIAAGTYRQKLKIRVPGLTIQGEGAENTAIIWDDYAKNPDEAGREYNTFRTWTAA